METHFDTQVVVRNHTEIILIPKNTENLSNQDKLAETTEMYTGENIIKNSNFVSVGSEFMFLTVPGLPDVLRQTSEIVC